MLRIYALIPNVDVFFFVVSFLGLDWRPELHHNREWKTRRHSHHSAVDRPAACLSRGWGVCAKTTTELGCVCLCVFTGVRLDLSAQPQLRLSVFSKRRQRSCVRASPGFSPPATELDLNSGGVRGDREGDPEGKEVTKHSRRAQEKKATRCSDKEKKERRFWLPPWCNVW